MANKVLHKRSNVSGKVPESNSLEYGELAVNYAAGNENLYTKNSNNTVVSFPSLNLISSAITSAVSAETVNRVTADAEIEHISAAALTDLEARIAALESAIEILNS